VYIFKVVRNINIRPSLLVRRNELVIEHFDRFVFFRKDKNGIHADCEQFQINDRTGSKLVAIDSSQIQVYTNDLTIDSSKTRLELPHLVTNSISSDKNLR